MNNDAIACLNIPDEEMAVIDKAATICGRHRADFIADCARCSAQALLNKRRIFVLSPEKWDKFVDALDKPVSHNLAFQKTLGSVGIAFLEN